MSRRPVAPAGDTGRLLPLLFFLSGASGLLFETAWTRLYRDLFGQTLHTTSAVLASFMLGLAVGAVLGGIAADRLARPLRLYGMLEAGIALFVLSSPAQLRFADRMTSSSPSDGWRWLAAFLLLLLPTMAMGATLPLLTRVLEREGQRGDRAVALLYGFNTLGAVLGVVGGGYVLIRHFGVTATIRTGSALGLAAGGAALLLASRHEVGVRSPEKETPAPSERFPLLALPLLFLTGFVALGFEVVWIRLFTFVIGSSILSFSLIVGVLLASMAAGSLISRGFLRPGDRRGEAVGWLQLALGAAAAPTLFPLLRPDLFRSLTRASAYGAFLPEALARTLFVAAVVAIPGLLMGAVLPCATAAFAEAGKAGRDVGRLYAATSLGNVAGALAAGYLLVPWLGATRGALALATVSVALGAVVVLGVPARRGARRLVLPFAAALVVASCWMWEGRSSGVTVFGFSNPHGTLLSAREGLLGTVTVFDVPPLPVLSDNRAPASILDVGYGYRVLAVNGVDVAGTSPDLRTTQILQAHIPLLLHGNPRRILQIGYGGGETAREAARWGPDSFDLVEINPDVIFEAGKWFPFRASGRFRAHFTDAKNFVRTSPATYDVILNDSTYPGVLGSSQLYSVEHFRACREHLRPGGLVSTWVPIDLPPETFRMVLASFRTVFPECGFWLPATCLNKHGVLVGSLGPIQRHVRRLLGATCPAEVEKSLAALGYRDPSGLVAALALDAEDIRALTDGAPTNSDDRPRLEYPAQGFRTSGESFWIETLELILKRRSGRQDLVAPADAVPAPDRRVAATKLVWEGELQLLKSDPQAALRLLSEAQATDTEQAGAGHIESGILVNQAQRAFAEAMDAISRNDDESAIPLLEDAVRRSPEAAAAQFELGRLLFSARRVKEAIPHLEACMSSSRKARTAYLLLGDAYLLTGRFAEAEARYRAYLRENPPRFEILAALGDALVNQGRDGEALPVLRRAAALSPDNKAVHGMIDAVQRRMAGTK